MAIFDKWNGDLDVNEKNEKALSSRILEKKILSPPNGSWTQVAILTLLSTYLSLQNGRPVSHMNLRVPHSSVVRVSNRHLEGHGFDSHWEDSEFFSEYSTWERYFILFDVHFLPSYFLICTLKILFRNFWPGYAN